MPPRSATIPYVLALSLRLACLATAAAQSAIGRANAW
jgi:hypothetical protein